MLLKDCCTFQEGYVNPDKKHLEYFINGTLNWIKATDLINGFIYTTEDKINEDGLNSCSNKTIFPIDSIVISKSGTIGNLGILKCQAYGNRATINIIVDKTKANPLYVYYVLLAKNEEVKQKAVGSIQKNLYISALETIELPTYDIKMQNKIVEILSNIDNQIERNNTMVKTLQDLGNTIFSAYFKDCKNVISFTEFPYCEILKPSIDKFDNTKHYIATAEVNGINLNFDAPLITYENRESRANMQPIKNSIWFAKLKNSIKHIYVPNNDTILINNYIFSTGFCGIKCDEIVYEFLIGFIESPYFEIMKDKLAHGATMESVNNDDLASINIPLPTKDMLEKYHTKTKNIYEQISMIQVENHKLNNLKSKLLPLLINGQLEI